MNLVIVGSNLENDDLFYKSLVNDYNIVLKQSDFGDNKDNVIKNLQENINIEKIALAYHYPGYDSLPFFYDKHDEHDLPLVINSLEGQSSEEKGETIKLDIKEPTQHMVRKHSEYHYFSDNLVSLLKELREKHNTSILDILTCDLNNPDFKREVVKLESNIGIDIRYSFNSTGNELDWILESDHVNIRDVYFNEKILEWNKLLTSVVGISELQQYNSTIISETSDNNNITTYTLLKDISISELLEFNANSCIQLSGNIVFDGGDYTIDLENTSNFKGLFCIESNVTNIENSPIIRNLGILNGSLQRNSGFFLIQSSKYFKIENCYSTGDINGIGAGGIAGGSAGNNGSCTITNCYSTGDINGSGAGGITGIFAGNKGSCTITNCYSTGDINGRDAGGIAGSFAAGNSGSCTIKNCYSTGSVFGMFPRNNATSTNSGNINQLKNSLDPNNNVTPLLSSPFVLRDNNSEIKNYLPILTIGTIETYPVPSERIFIGWFGNQLNNSSESYLFENPNDDFSEFTGKTISFIDNDNKANLFLAENIYYYTNIDNISDIKLINDISVDVKTTGIEVKQDKITNEYIKGEIITIDVYKFKIKLIVGSLGIIFVPNPPPLKILLII